jgi:hypothetical protein
MTDVWAAAGSGDDGQLPKTMANLDSPATHSSGRCRSEQFLPRACLGGFRVFLAHEFFG